MSARAALNSGDTGCMEGAMYFEKG
jgi:hypothetical protein